MVERIKAWTSDLWDAVRWWGRWGVWSPPTRRLRLHGSTWPLNRVLGRTGPARTAR
jgi:hypothetical protein